MCFLQQETKQAIYNLDTLKLNIKEIHIIMKLMFMLMI